MKQQKMQRLSTSFSLSLSRIRKLASLAARMIFTPSLCVLLALASVILVLA